MEENSEALLSTIAEADREAEKRLDFEGRRLSREKQKKELLERHREQKDADARLKRDVRLRNEDYRRSELRDFKEQQEREAMWDEEQETRRRMWLCDLEAEGILATVTRARMSRGLEGGSCSFIPRGASAELRSQNPRRILDTLRRFSSRPAVLGQGFIELSQLLSCRPELCEAVRRLGASALVCDALRGYPEILFVQEQGVTLICRLCERKECIRDLHKCGAFKVLMEGLSRVGGKSHWTRPLQLLIVRALGCLSAVLDPMLRPTPKEEQLAMATILSMIKENPLRARLHEASLQLLCGLMAQREENVLWLLMDGGQEQQQQQDDKAAAAAAGAGGLVQLLEWLLGQYEVLDVRISRAESAGVVREVIRGLTVACAASSQATAGQVLSSELLVRLFKTVRTTHAKDPLVQLFHLQLWEVLMDRHATLVRTTFFPPLLKPLVSLVVQALRDHLRIHMIQFRGAVLLELLLAGLPRPEAIPLIVIVVEAEATPVLEQSLRECAAEASVLDRLLRVLRAYCVDVKFRSACTRDEMMLVEVVKSSLLLHPDVKVIQELGCNVTAALA